MDPLVVFGLAVIVIMGIATIVTAFMYFMNQEASVTRATEEPNPTRAVDFERNIPGGKSGDDDQD